MTFILEKRKGKMERVAEEEGKRERKKEWEKGKMKEREWKRRESEGEGKINKGR